MKSFQRLLIVTGALVLFGGSLCAQTEAPKAVQAVSHSTNSAVIPAPRTDDWSLKRTRLVLQRAKDHPGRCDVVFIGDSITQGWERTKSWMGDGKKAWEKYYGKLNALNLGVSGDRTQHVLWRFAHGQLDGLKPKVTVVMIGTNNSNKDDNTAGEILAGVKAIVEQIRARLPDTKILLLGIFPRGATFNPQRGKILQVNQALAKLDDGKMIYYLDIGSKLIEDDGSLTKETTVDYLHLTAAGYEIWAKAMQPELNKLLTE